MSQYLHLSQQAKSFEEFLSFLEVVIIDPNEIKLNGIHTRDIFLLFWYNDHREQIGDL
jgi:hypothetical protein